MSRSASGSSNTAPDGVGTPSSQPSCSQHPVPPRIFASETRQENTSVGSGFTREGVCHPGG